MWKLVKRLCYVSLRRGWCELFNVDIISTDYSLICLLVQQQKCIKARRKHASRETYQKTLRVIIIF